MRHNINPEHAINFANINSGDIIIADTLTNEDTFFVDAYNTRYALYTVETCNKVNNAILSPLTDAHVRSTLTQDGETCIIKSINGNNYHAINTAKVWHYTYYEAAKMRLYERAVAQDALRGLIHGAYNNFMPHQVEREFEGIYARHTGEQGHDATSIINPDTSREVMSRIIEDGIKVIRRLLNEDHVIIGEGITEALAAYAENCRHHGHLRSAPES